MKTIGSYEAKTKLSNLLERVANGEQFTITKHGTPIAQLIPVAGFAKSDSAKAIAEILKFRKDKRLREKKLKALIREGQKH